MSCQKKRIRRPGDRKDGALVRDLDSMHFITPLIYPNRCDNEAFITETIDLANINHWLDEHNRDEKFKYTFFHLIVAAVIKTITLRPKMNRFIANRNMYQRNEVSAAFVVKKQFTDEAGEALAFIHASPTDTVFDLHEKLYRQISSCRSEKKDASTGAMDLFNSMPRFISKTLVDIIRVLDKHGLCPQSLIATDPYYSSVVLSNLGSIKLQSGYHHLTNWGTTSMFCIVGEKKTIPFYQPDGSFEMRETITLGLTIDERLADGYYYSCTVRLLKKLLENPELLELPANEEVKF